MGVWYDLFITSRSIPQLLDEAFVALLRDLLQSDMVATPFAVMTGQLDPSSPLGIANVGNGLAAPDVDVVYRGENATELLANVQDLLLRKVDFCVWFNSLGSNQALWDSLHKQGCYYSADVIIYTFTSPRQVLVLDAWEGTSSEHCWSQYVAITGKGGPNTIEGTPLEQLLSSYFGNDLIVECAAL